MLVFMDESGIPHPNDQARRPVVAAVCLREQDVRSVATGLHELKRDVLGSEETEMKASRLLVRSTFRSRPPKVAKEVTFVEQLFEWLSDVPFTVFATIMESPAVPPDPKDPALPIQIRFLTERVQLFAESEGEMATILYDGVPKQSGGLFSKFRTFLYDSNEGRALEGRALVNITDAPFFGDSEAYPGIQIADMVASVIRQYEEGELSERTPEDQLLSAIKRYFHIIERKTIDQTSHEGHAVPGLYRMWE